MADAMSVFNTALFISISLAARDILLTPSAQKSPSGGKNQQGGQNMEGVGAAASSGPTGPQMKFLICYG